MVEDESRLGQLYPGASTRARVMEVAPRFFDPYRGRGTPPQDWDQACWSPSRQGILSDTVSRHHWERYLFASHFYSDLVIDVACGVGYGTHLLYGMGATILGIDIDKQAIEFANKDYPGPNYVQCDLREIPELGKFETVLAFEKFEHLDNPRVLLDAAQECLSDDGILYLSTPNEVRYPFVPEERVFEEYPHFRHYTPDQLDALLVDGGFKVVSRWCQRTKKNCAVTPGLDGMFLVYMAEKTIV